jgi:hypothetical protein
MRQSNVSDNDNDEDSRHKFFCINFQYYVVNVFSQILKETNVHIIMNAGSSGG